MSVQCRICESGEFDSLESLKEHLEEEHNLSENDLIQYGSDFHRDIDVLLEIHKIRRMEKGRKIK